MPSYKEIKGHNVVINTGDEHPPPHVHVFGPGGRASVAISGGALLKGKCDRKVLKEVKQYLAENEDYLLAEWTRFREADENGDA